MAELTEEAKAAIKAEIKDFIAENQKILDEVSIYRWIFRAGFVIFLGGSIFGVLQIQKYVDNKIAEQVEKLDHLTLANNLALNSQGRAALYELDVFMDEYYKFRSSGTSIRSENEKEGFRVTDFLTDSQREFSSERFLNH